MPVQIQMEANSLLYSVKMSLQVLFLKWNSLKIVVFLNQLLIITKKSAVLLILILDILFLVMFMMVWML